MLGENKEDRYVKPSQTMETMEMLQDAVTLLDVLFVKCKVLWQFQNSPQ